MCYNKKGDFMKVTVVKDKKNKPIYKLNMFLEWIIYMLVYACVMWVASQIFKSLYIENFFVGFLAAVIMYVLNKTVKPFLVQISLPLIGMTLGLFYFIINVIILLLTDLLLGKYFYLTGFFSPFVVSIFISVTNLILEGFVIKPLIERCEKNESDSSKHR